MTIYGINPAYCVSGLGVGVLVGLTGVGGGSLMTPLLVLAFGIHPTTAVGTDLLFAAVTKSIGTVVHGAGRTIDWRVVRRLAAGSVPATVVSLLAERALGRQGAATGHAIALMLGAALLVTAVTVLFRPAIIAWSRAHIGEPSPVAAARLTVAMGAVLGVLVSVSSVGAGAIGVTALILLYRDMKLPRIVATDIAHAVPLTLIAGVGHWWLGDVAWLLLASLLIGSIPGIVAGSLLIRYVPELVLRPTLACVLVLVGIRMLA